MKDHADTLLDMSRVTRPGWRYRPNRSVLLPVRLTPAERRSAPGSRQVREHDRRRFPSRRHRRPGPGRLLPAPRLYGDLSMTTIRLRNARERLAHLVPRGRRLHSIPLKTSSRPNANSPAPSTDGREAHSLGPLPNPAQRPSRKREPTPKPRSTNFRMPLAPAYATASAGPGAPRPSTNDPSSLRPVWPTTPRGPRSTPARRGVPVVPGAGPGGPPDGRQARPGPRARTPLRAVQATLAGPRRLTKPLHLVDFHPAHTPRPLPIVR